jgi:hypothetical protein
MVGEIAEEGKTAVSVQHRGLFGKAYVELRSEMLMVRLI